MRIKRILKSLALLSAIGLVCPSVLARPDAAEITSALTKLFGGNDAFSTKAEIKVMDEDQKEGTLPLSLAWLEGKMRAELDLSQVKSHRLPADFQSGLKKAGLEKVIAVILPQGPLAYIISPGLKAYAEQALPKPDSSAKADAIKFEKSAIGNETIDGHRCIKNKVVLRTGDETQEITAWTASDMKDFPLRIQMEIKGHKVSLNFKDVKFVKPDAKEFNAPEGYTKHTDAQGLLSAALNKFAAATSP